METIDILQLIYDRSGIDEKMALRKAFPDLAFASGKLTLPDIVVKRIVYVDLERLYPPRDTYLFDLYPPERRHVQRPHDSREFSTVYISSPDSIALHTGPYRIEKHISQDDVRTQVWTSSKIDFEFPRCVGSSYYHRHYKHHLDGFISPWKNDEEYYAYLRSIPRLDMTWMKTSSANPW